jgi:hypothetical protein
MLGVLGAIALFFVQFILIAFILVRALVVPLTLLVVEPNQLARRLLRGVRRFGKEGRSRAALDVNVDAKDLERILNGWQATGAAIVLCVIGFLLERHAGFLFLALGFALPRVTASKDPVDERRFEQFTRTLAATSDAAIVGMLFLVMIFRPVWDAFGLLAFVFMMREVLLVLARRWLESEPDFEQYDEQAGPTIALTNTAHSTEQPEASGTDTLTAQPTDEKDRP